MEQPPLDPFARGHETEFTTNAFLLANQLANLDSIPAVFRAVFALDEDDLRAAAAGLALFANPHCSARPEIDPPSPGEMERILRHAEERVREAKTRLGS